MRLLSLLALVLALPARAESVNVNFVSIDLKSRSPSVFTMTQPVDLSPEIFHFPKVAGEHGDPKKGCHNQFVSNYSRPSSITFRELNGAKLNEPFTLECPEGVTFNIASLVKDQKPKTAEKASNQLFGFLKELNDLALSAPNCKNGVIFTKKTDGFNTESDQLYNSMKKLTGLPAKAFASVRKSGKTITVTGGPILNVLGVKQVSCSDVGTRKMPVKECKVTIPGTGQAKCVGKRAANDPAEEDEMVIKSRTERPEPSINRPPALRQRVQ